MDPALVTVLSAVLVIAGIVGIVVPILPGLLLVWIGIAVWSVATGGTVGWTVLGVATLIVIVGSIVKYLLPGRRLRESGVPWTTVTAGGVLGVVGFFVIPVVGLFVGFVLGIYLAELYRLRTHDKAWPATKLALFLVGWSILIELATGLVAAAVWGAGLALA